MTILVEFLIQIFKHCVIAYLGLSCYNKLTQGGIKGINTNMNTDIETAFVDDYVFEAFLAEAAIQSLMMGAYIDVTDVKNTFKHDHFKQIVLKNCANHGIK